MAAAVEAALRRHRAVTIGALVALALIAWAWLFAGAGMDMEPLGPPAHGPGMAMDGRATAMAPPAASAAPHYGLMVAMWWSMMIAMMLPSAAPMILLYARVSSKAQTEARPATGSFLAGYLMAWGGFSLAAASLQQFLQRSDLLAPMAMTSQSRWLSAALLVAAGFYQISPAKDVCLRQCRNPAQFLSSHYRPGRWGALRMGLIHGGYCVGCCWLLMALLFVGGVMSLAWIALLTLLVALEKLLPFGRQVSIAAGIACLVAGALVLFF